MKVLIIGAKGMLGQELAKAFAEAEVFAWDREEIDITEFQSSNFKIQNLKPDVVINAAAYNNVDGAETEPAVANKINGYAVGFLAQICKELDIPLVHYSSDYVFAGDKKDGYAEAASPDPVSAYGRSKLLGEQELAKNTDKYYLIRLSRLFGAAGGGKKSFPEVMLSLAAKKTEIEVVDEELSCPTYAPDLAKLTRVIVEQKPPFGIYHGAGNGSCTWFGFAEAIFKLAGKNVKLKAVPGTQFKRPARRPRYSVLLNTKLPQARPWEEALKEFLTI